MLDRYRTEVVPRQEAAARRGAPSLLALARSLEIVQRALVEGAPADLNSGGVDGGLSRIRPWTGLAQCL